MLFSHRHLVLIFICRRLLSKQIVFTLIDMSNLNDKVIFSPSLSMYHSLYVRTNVSSPFIISDSNCGTAQSKVIGQKGLSSSTYSYSLTRCQWWGMIHDVDTDCIFSWRRSYLNVIKRYFIFLRKYQNGELQLVIHCQVLKANFLDQVPNLHSEVCHTKLRF